MGKSCPHHQPRIPTTPDWDESDREPEVQKDERQNSDWDADLEEEKDNVDRAPFRHPKQLPKAILYQTRRPPAGWPSRMLVKPASPKIQI